MPVAKTGAESSVSARPFRETKGRIRVTTLFGLSPWMDEGAATPVICDTLAVNLFRSRKARVPLAPTTEKVVPRGDDVGDEDRVRLPLAHTAHSLPGSNSVGKMR